MKRLYVIVCSAAFFLAALLALADLQYSDVVRWGLLRKGEVLPVGATITYRAGGVLRVIEAQTSLDTNRFVLTVTSNLVTDTSPELYGLSNGVYLSEDATRENGYLEIWFPDFWYYSEGRQSLLFSTAGLTNDDILVLGATTNVITFLPYPLRAGTFGPDENGIGFRISEFETDPNDLTVACSVNDVEAWVVENVRSDTNNVTLHAYGEGAGGTLTLALSGGTYAALENSAVLDTMWFCESNAPCAFSQTNGAGVVNYWSGTTYTTNDFVSQTLLQDTIDDLRLEISEAIEAHVELLH